MRRITDCKVDEMVFLRQWGIKFQSALMVLSLPGYCGPPSWALVLVDSPDTTPPGRASSGGQVLSSTPTIPIPFRSAAHGSICLLQTAGRSAGYRRLLTAYTLDAHNSGNPNTAPSPIGAGGESS